MQPLFYAQPRLRTPVIAPLLLHRSWLRCSRALTSRCLRKRSGPDFSKISQDKRLYNGVIGPGETLRVWEWGDSNDFLVHGIRHHETFAKSSEVTDICKIYDRYARARNARLIMSNTIPDMAYQAVVSYCIWYPDVATEDTYRKLYRRYPEMRYHIGRACAVAGYGELYNELDLLPDVSIAEEARDNGKIDIFEHIMSQSVRYAVMNDYQRSVDLQNPRPGAYLNGDTAVRSSLELHRPLTVMGGPPERNPDLKKWPSHYFNIQEDSNISGCPSPGPRLSNLQGEYIALLHTPLPEDLPPINKDILILMAAWDGNIERYSRLRQPSTVPNEITAVVRGAYHHTPFARWLESCVDELFPRQYENRLIRQACHARFIMNDDLSRIDSEIDGETLPELFWWPHCPDSDTLRELAWRRPDLKHQVILACIAGDYQYLFLELFDGMKPAQEQWEAALHSYNEFYKETIEMRAKEEGLEFHKKSEWSKEYLRPTKELYRGNDELGLTKEIFNEPDQHCEDWHTWSMPEDNLFNFHMHFQMAKWQQSITATDEARQGVSMKAYRSLYSTKEDYERRLGPPP